MLLHLITQLFNLILMLFTLSMLSFHRFREFACLQLNQKRFCVDCQLLLLPAEWNIHDSHRLLSGDLTISQLRRPSLLLQPLENKKTNAQYLFADRSCRFLLNVLSGLGFQKVLCIGTPRWVWIHAQQSEFGHECRDIFLILVNSMAD